MFDTIIGLIVAVRSGKLRVKLNGELQVKNEELGTFHTVSVAGLPTEETLTIGAGES